MADRHVHIAIIGAGFSGIAVGAKLREAGIGDFLIFERGDRLGGVWRDNTYPGCACDIESPLYSYSFAPNPDWSRMYSPQAEILAYLEGVAQRCGLIPHLRCGHAIEGARWDEASQRWQLDSSRGRYTADLLVAGMGALSEPVIPPFPGRERFAGASFHSARWGEDATIDHKRVAVIGTGASAIQIVPAIQPRVASLRLFQRTPAWVIPRRDRAFGPLERRLFSLLPPSQKLLRAAIYLRHEATIVAFRNPALMRLAERVALRYLESEVRDPELRAKLRPSFTFGCKRVLVSSDYLPALTQPKVEVVTDGVREIVPEGIVDLLGNTHELDTIVYATGFRVANPPFAEYVHGRDGRSLAERWQGSPEAFWGTTVAGFPNLFLMTGPNTGLGHSSMVVMIEAQARLILAAIEALHKSGARSLEPRPEAQARWVADIREGGAGTVWTAGGCASWYLDETGRNSTLWPWSTYRFMRQARFEASDYRMT